MNIEHDSATQVATEHGVIDAVKGVFDVPAELAEKLIARFGFRPHTPAPEAPKRRGRPPKTQE